MTPNERQPLPSRRGFAGVVALAATGAILPRGLRGLSAAAPAGTDSAVALQWYDLTTRTVAAAGYPEQITQSRAWAVSWLAAARAIPGSADPGYAVPAFASAVHDALAALVPAQRPQLDTALTATLAAIPAGAAKNRGIAAGQREAAAVLNERTTDGLDTASVDIPWVQPPPAPGVYQLTPLNYAPATLAGQGRARPFLLTSGSQFRLGPPPELDSATYLNNLAEVHAYGSPASSVRTTAQTDVARFWAQASLAAYIQVVRAVLADSARPLSWQARLVAAFHAITIDAQIAVYDTKYVYTFWRAVTAIRTGNINPDPSWLPLTLTPPNPDYPSGHCGYAGAAEVALAALAGPRPVQPISVTSSTDPGSVRAYLDWRTLTQENIDGRVWEGVHFRHSDETGATLGRQAGRYGLTRLHAIGL